MIGLFKPPDLQTNFHGQSWLKKSGFGCISWQLSFLDLIRSIFLIIYVLDFTAWLEEVGLVNFHGQSWLKKSGFGCNLLRIKLFLLSLNIFLLLH